MAVAPRKILVLKWRALGDTVLLSASLSALHRAFPRAQIDVCVAAPWAPLLEGIPGIHKIIPYERRNSRRARLRALMRLGFELRAEKYDAVLNFHASPSSSTIALATGAKIRAVHFHGHRDRNRQSTVEIPGKGVLKPILERDLDVIRALGVDVPSQRFWPQVVLRSDELTHARERLGGEFKLTGPLLGMGLGASRPTKAWGSERFAELAQHWLKTQKGSVVAFAGPGENTLVQDFRKALAARLSATELTRVVIQDALSIRELAATIGALQAFVGNDSGPRHLAVAVGVPSVTLFGPEDPFEWHPYSQDQHPYLFVPNLACRKDALPGYPAWCGLQTCVVEKHRCMTEISVSQVAQTLQILTPGAAHP